MGLAPGTSLGAYEILEAIGAGGMGEVYRARDSKLDRFVAIKVLPESIAANPDALARFRREAKAVAALSHPNILAIHDLGEHDGRRFAVMELLEGETLRERLRGGPLPPRKAADLARQAARGLAAAHEKGIVHRDLKPENLFVTRDGRIKILDFGLARTIESGPGSRDETDATRTSVTTPGMVMGTVGYMSPEQASGGVAEPRSDIFSLGAILYEMLTGVRAFQRETAVETMAAILREEPPDLADAAPEVPAALARVVRRCLEKRPAERFQSAHDLGFAIANAAEATTASAAVPTLAAPARTRSRPLRWIAVPLLVGAGLLAGWALGTRLDAPDAREPVRVRTLTFSGRDGAPSVSPDGNTVAFASDRDGTPRIWLRQLSGGGEAALTTGPDQLPRFSHDGASVYFIRGDGADGSAYRVPIVGGQPRIVLEDAYEVDPSPDGDRVAFLRAGEDVSILGIAGLATGDERVLARLERRGLYGLAWSPDGRKIAVTEASPFGNLGDYSVDLVDVASGSIERVTPSERVPISGATWTPSGRQVLFAQSASLLGSVANPSCRVVLRDVRGNGERILYWTNNLVANLGWNFSRFAIPGPGRLVFNEIDVRQSLREQPLDGGSGSAITIFTSGSSRDRQPAYSPDGSRVIFSSNRSGNLDLWTIDVRTGAVHQITDDAANDWDPDFTPDGESILWSSDRGGNLEIWIADADGGRPRQLTNDGVDAENPTATADGKWVVYWSANPEKIGIWRVNLDGTEATRLVEGILSQPDVSPDGRWAAYLDVGVQATATSGSVIIRVVEVASGEVAPFLIEEDFTRGGNQVWGRMRWMPDGRRLVYVGQDEDGLSGLYVQEFRPGEDTRASRRRLAGFSREYATESFDVSPDGRRVVISAMSEAHSLKLADNVPGI